MRVLFASSLANPSASGNQRFGALCTLGHRVDSFQLDGYDTRSSLEAKIRQRFASRPFRPSDAARFGRELCDAVHSSKPDVVWLEKPLLLQRQWLAAARDAAPKAHFVCFQDDDPFGSRRSESTLWKDFVDCIPFYDVHFVKRSVNVEEFRARGAPRVLLFMHGVYSPIFHPSLSTGAQLQHDVVFVGTPLDHRVRQVYELLRRRVPLEIYGNSWSRTWVYWTHRPHFHPAVLAERYARLLAASKIALGFVSSSNRDEYSMRTFEIPACGAMLLAERTPTHLNLYREGVEAEFFSTIEECADKCRFYLANEPARARLAKRGHERCQRDDYSLRSRMERALLEIVASPAGPTLSAQRSK